MSKIFDVEKMYGQDFSIVTTNAPSNVIKNSDINLLPNIMLISSPEDKINVNNDNNYPSLFVTDYNANPLQLTYPLYFKDGLSKSEEYGYAYINIDRKTIATSNEDGTGALYVNTNNLERASIDNYGVVKIAEEMGIDRDYKIGNIELPNDSFIDVNDDGIIYLSNNFFEWIGDIITKQVKEKVDNIKLILNNNLRIWLEITDTNILEIGSIYNLNTANSSIDINASDITSMTFNLKYLSFYNDSENVRFSDISEHNIYKIEYNGSNITNQNILTTVEEYNEDLFLHSIDNISLTFLPNYYINEYNLNNNEEYNLSIEFTNNSSHPTEKITFKQPQLFDTSDKNKFKIELSENSLSIQDVLNNKVNTIIEQITNNVFNNIKDNEIDITKYYIYTYILHNEVKWPLIDRQEYSLNSGNISISTDVIKDLVRNIIMLYLQTSEELDRYEIISNQNFIDTIDNTINIICEFIININNKEYTYTHTHPMTLLLLKSVLYGLFTDKIESIENSNKIKQYYLQTSNQKLLNMSQKSKNEIKEDLDNGTISLTKFIGIIDTDLFITNSSEIYYNININNVYNYERDNDHYELEEYEDYTNNFTIKPYVSEGILDIQPVTQDGNFYISIQVQNYFTNVIKSLIQGLTLETQYGEENSTIMNNNIEIHLDILDILLHNVTIYTLDNNQFILSDKYNFNKDETYAKSFGENTSYGFTGIEANSFNKIEIIMPNYIKYLLNATSSDSDDQNRFGFEFSYGNNAKFKTEIFASGSGYTSINYDSGAELDESDNAYKVNVDNNGKITITGNAINQQDPEGEKVFPVINSCVFTLRNVNKSTGENVNSPANDIFFTKTITFNTSLEDIKWDGFVYKNN